MTIADRDSIAEKKSPIAIGDLLIGDRSCSTKQGKTDKTVLNIFLIFLIASVGLVARWSGFHAKGLGSIGLCFLGWNTLSKTLLKVTKGR